MGQNDRAYNRKETQANKAAEKRKRRSNVVSSSGVADWASVDGTLLATMVATVARMGGALRLGYTRDGGAYAVGVYGDGDPFTEYYPPETDMDEMMKGMIEDYGK